MKIKTKKAFVYLFGSILVISFAALAACDRAEKEQRLAESICIVTSEGCSPIISRGTKLPTSFTQTFTNMVPEQDSVQISIYQGEDSKAEANRLVGSFDFPIGKANQPGEASLQVTIIIDQTKRLTIIAKDFQTGRQDEIIAGVVN